MALKTGDRVKFLNDVGGGVLTAFLDKKQAMVRTADGFEIPVLLAELVADPGNFMPDRKPEEPAKIQETKSPPKKSITPPKRVVENHDEQVCFAILPKTASSDLFAYMINNSSYNIHYVISTHDDDQTQLFDQGNMEPRTQMKVRKFIPDNLNHLKRFDIQLLFFKEDYFIPRDPVSMSVFMNPSEVYSGKALEENEFFEKRALVFSLSNFNKKTSFSYSGGTNVTKLMNEKINQDRPEPVSREEKKTKSELEEVDLHIGAITDNFSGLSNSEIIDMQMARFKITLDTAIIHKTRRIVFIHGIGNGKLKFTLRKALEEKYPDLQYQDASFKEYGYGATMVIIP